MNRLVSGVRSGKLVKVVMCFAALAFLLVFYGLAVRNTPETEAVMATDFQAGRIIDDAVFYNANTMTVEEIQAFLDEKLPTCDMWGTGSSAGRVVSETGYVMPAGSTNADYARLRAAAGNTRYHEPPYVCVNKYYENPETHETLYETKGIVKDGMISAAQIIYNEAQRYSINPQVLLVLLKKESYVWGDTWPLKWEYNSAMGYGCPDTAPCDTAYYGFYNQVHMAAYQFDRYKQKNYEYNYHPGMTNNIYYSPTYSCGTKQVYIENMATASLYIYTPYTPNDAALRNYPGTAECGSYGNRNFFMYFSEWFGDTVNNINLSALKVPDGDYYIGNTDGYLSAKNGSMTNVNSLAEATVLRFRALSGGIFSISDPSSDSMLCLKSIDDPLSSFGVGFCDVEHLESANWIIRESDAGDIYLSPASYRDYFLALSSSSYSLSYIRNDVGGISLTPANHEVKDGIYKIKPYLGGDLVLDLLGGASEQTAFTEVGYFNQKKTSNDNQSFNIAFDSESGFYSIVNTVSGLSLDVKGADIENGTKIISYRFNGGCNQKWGIVKSGDGYNIISACSMRVLDVPAGEFSRQKVIIYDWNGGDNQRWMLYNSDRDEEAGESADDEKASAQGSDSSNIIEGEYKIVSKVSSMLAIDILGGVKEGMIYGDIGFFPRKNTINDNQTFSVELDKETNSYYLVNPLSGLVLDVQGNNLNNGTKIIGYRRNSGCNQRWNFEKIEGEEMTYYIHSACDTEKVIDLPRGDFSLQKVIVFDKNNGDNQKWLFISN